MTLVESVPVTTDAPSVEGTITDAQLAARLGLPDPTPAELEAALAMVE